MPQLLAGPPTLEQLQLLASEATLADHGHHAPQLLGRWPVLANAAGWWGWQAAAVLLVEDRRRLGSPQASAVLVVALLEPGRPPRWLTAVLACWPC